MIDLRDDYFRQAENNYIQLAVCSTIGGRKEQQDRAGFELSNEKAVVAVCDGMGGHSGGKQASNIVVEQLLQRWKEQKGEERPQAFLLKTVLELDQMISSLTSPNGDVLRSGTTMSAVILEKKQLHWVSVGDSRIYIYRSPEFVRVTRDHTYCALQQAGQLPQNLPQVKNPESVLVSFIGVGDISRIERNRTPIELQSGDYIILISDGLYKLLRDNEIQNVICKGTNVSDIAQTLIGFAQDRARTERLSSDNITVAVVKVK